MTSASQWNAIASAMAEHGRLSVQKANRARTEADAARKSGTKALSLGITDYRKPPEPSIDAEDWAVWLVEWDGKRWHRNRRLAGNKSLTEALNRITALCRERGLERFDFAADGR